MSELEEFFRNHFAAEPPADELTRRFARAVAALLQSERYQGGELVACLRDDGTGNEVVVVDIHVTLGQRKTKNDIREIERVGIVVYGDDRLPLIYPLRDGFPESVPHFNLSGPGEPRSLCLFDVPEEEAVRLASPFVLLERARHWMRETAYGRLHSDDQPLDPFFGASSHTVVLPRHGEEDTGEVVVGFRRSEEKGFPILLTHFDVAEKRGLLDEGRNSFATIFVETPPLPHGRIRALPNTMAQLIHAYQERGVDLTDLLHPVLSGWVRDGTRHALLKHKCLIVIRTPIERSPGSAGGETAKAFLTECTAGKLAEAMGAMLAAEGHIGPPLKAGAADPAALQEIVVGPVDVHRAFDRPLACTASGYAETENPLEITLVGAGALGSQFAITAARGGLGRWAIVDPDHLMPHNLARHALSPFEVGVSKAQGVAQDIQGLLGEDAGSAYVANIQALGREKGSPLNDAALVVDASASVPTASWLAFKSDHTARTVSVFFNPKGTDLVVLQEGPERSPRLDHMEMSYYWQLVVEPDLRTHLHGGSGIIPSGGCRQVSLQLPQSRVGAFAALSVRSVLEQPAGPEGALEFWHMTDEGIARCRFPGERYRELAIGEWAVVIRESVIEGIRDARRAAGEMETGGILVGSWDRSHNRIYVVGHFDAPPDSEHSRTGFVRGMVGVYETLECIESATAANLSYIGEWHTHPPCSGSEPSTDDENLLRWIGDILVFSDVPPVMLIAGEDGLRLLLDSVENGVVLT